MLKNFLLVGAGNYGAMGISLIISNVNVLPHEVFEATRLTRILDVRRKETYAEV